MSRRHTITSAVHPIPPDIPFIDDLVFYAPLNNGELFDYVSGCEPITDTNGGSATEFASCIWDNNVNMYKLHVQQANSSISQFLAALRWMSCDLYTGVSGDNILDRGITMSMQIQYVSGGSADWNPICLVDEFKTCSPNADGRGNGEDMTTARVMLRKTDVGNINALSKCAITWSPNGIATWYRGGSQVKRSTTWNVHVFTNPTTISMLQIIRGTSYEEIYAKDVRIYNRTLTASEITQL